MSWLREPDAEPLPGYRLIEPLGSGGFGEVWKCVAPGGIFKAIKFVYGNLESDEADAARAEQEYRALQRIKEVRHPFVLSMDRIEVVEGEIAIVMELADKNLHDAFVECQSRGLVGIPRGDLLRYLSDAAEALDYLYGHFNLQHLDVKPRNLFVIADRVKVADFGLVKNLERASSAGVMGGVTPIYAAPETFSGKLSRYCDQYSLAIVYIELLTGKRPFHGKNVRQIALQHMTEPPDLSSLPEADRPVLARALSKDPDKRFPNCVAFVRAVPAVNIQSMAEVDLNEEADLGQGTSSSGPGDALDADGSPPTCVLQHGAAPAETPRAAAPVVAGPRAFRSAQTPSEHFSPGPREAETGVLRPTLLIGVGSFGRQALLELRCRLLDRFGDLQHIPALRYLYLDSDPDAVQKATAATSEVALSSAEVFPLPLQPVSNYRRRMLDHLLDWLPREKLYSIPRSLQPLGSRALGRLTFCDSFLRIQSRLRRELMTATRADVIAQSAEATKLTISTSSPRVIVLVGASEGIAGMLADLAYTLRRTLDQLHLPDAQTIGCIYCGTPFDPATPALEQSNLYATLTELNHYYDDGVSFVAQYGPEGPQISDCRPPFTGVYLALRHERTPAGLRESLAHLATFLTHEIATPLGPELDRLRQQAGAPQLVPFQSFGTSTSWYPRGLLLRVAARLACTRVLEAWRSTEAPTARQQAEQLAQRAVADCGLKPEALLEAIDAAASPAGDGTPREATDRFLASLESQAGVTEDVGAWAMQTLERVKEWCGSGTGCDPDTTWKKSRFYRAMQLAAKQLSDDWDKRLAGEILEVLTLPGHRLSNAEATVRHLSDFCTATIKAQRQLIERHYEAVNKIREELHAAVAQCQAGTRFAFFGSSRQRSLRHFLHLCAQFARLRIAQDLQETVLQFFKFLQGHFEDRINDLGFARQRLKALQQVLASPGQDSAFDEHSPGDSPVSYHDPFWQSVQSSPTVEIVLPGGVATLEESAGQFVDSLRSEHWLRLDRELQEKVLAPLGNVVSACTGNMNLTRYMGAPLVEQAAQFLAGILPITDVAQVEFSAAKAQGVELPKQFQKFYGLAAPFVSGHSAGGQRTYLLLPDSEDGTAIGDLARTAIPDLKLIRIDARTEMTICRVQTGFSHEEFQKLLDLSRLSYQESAPQPATSPHARFDVVEWAPLEP